MSTPSSAGEAATDPGGDQTIAAPPRTLRPSVATELVCGGTIDRYLLVHEIGRGATSVVWAAYDVDIDRKVAIKLAVEPIGDDPERRKRSLGEAQAMAKIRHPNVVLVHDVGTWQDHLYIAMEFVDGTTLGQWWRGAERSVAEILDVFVAAARGLAAAHAVGLVHRDFKPDNVLIGGGPAEHDRVRVADFGLAQTIDPTTPIAGEDATGMPRVVGTPAYMSPEHQGGGLVDARSDQFAFCVALFEALAGERPFRGESLAELAAATVLGAIDPDAAARVPPRIRRVLAVGLAVDPGKRHASMDELVAALTRARRPRWPIVVAIAAAMTIVGAAWNARQQSSDDPCHRGTAFVREVWNESSRASIELAPGELTAAYTERVQQRMLAALDDYAASWAELSDAVCRAGLGRERSEDPLAEQRAACVDDRLAAFAGLVRLAGGEAIAAARVDALLVTLPRIDQCQRDDVAAWEPVPADVETATKVAALRERLRDAELVYAAGRIREVAGEVEAIAAAARETGYPHLTARTLVMLATIDNDRGHPDRSAQLLDEGLALALAAGHDRLAGRIAVERVQLAVGNLGYDREIEHWASLARALFERVGGDELASGDLASALGTIYFNRGELERALAQTELAVAAYRSAPGADNLYASAEVGCAAMLAALGRTDEAWARASEAMRVIETKLGREHPEAQSVLAMMGLVDDARGNTDAAIDTLYEALEYADSTFGPNSRQVSNITYNLFYVLGSRGRLAEAQTMLARSRAAWPVADDVTAEAQYSEAEASLAQLGGRNEAALQLIDQAIQLYQASAPEYVSRQSDARLTRAAILLELGGYREALETYETAYREWSNANYRSAWLLDATIAADALGDRGAVALWLARAESRPRHGETDELIARITRAIATRHLEAARRDRDRLAELRFAGHPLVRRIDASIARTAGASG